jgi:tetratricopeptide (TPR) repeat protein
MFQPKFGLYALTLELSAWAGVALGASDERSLLLYLLAHGGASIVIALIAITFLPPHLAKPRQPILLLLFSTSYAIPVLGIVAVLGSVFVLHALPASYRSDAFRAVDLPEIDPHLRPGIGFRQAGMRSFLSNSRAPVATRLRALVALQNISGRVASPLLRDVLTDPSEDIRLLAYGILDNKEKRLAHSIHSETKHLNSAIAGSVEQTEAAKRLADLYWELVYQELAQGDLRLHALQQSLHYTQISLQQTPDDAGLHLRHGRLLQSLGQSPAARDAYDRALALGLPKTRIVPYLAEVAYDVGDFNTVRALMNELGDWQSLPRLRPVILYWSQA